MKIVEVLVTPQQVAKYIYNLWATKEFRESHKNNGFIAKIVELYSKYPRLVADMTDENVEHSQFYSWFNILMKRTYQNPYIQDLYYLHELYHIATMPYSGAYSFEKWGEKMLDNEMNASLSSEVLVYHYLPIRQKTFNFEIWYDTLEPYQLLDVPLLIEKRKNAMKSPTRDVEKILNKYYNSNFFWLDLWKSEYQNVETALDSFYKTKDVKQLMSWISQNVTDGVLFKPQAEAFAKFYHQNLKQGIL